MMQKKLYFFNRTTNEVATINMSAIGFAQSPSSLGYKRCTLKQYHKAIASKRAQV